MAKSNAPRSLPASVPPRRAAEHGEAATQRRLAVISSQLIGIADGGNYSAVVAAVDLMQETAVPFQRQPHFEIERIMATVDANSRVGFGGNDAGRWEALVRGRGSR
jgi:hypothetical protein